MFPVCFWSQFVRICITSISISLLIIPAYFYSQFMCICVNSASISSLIIPAYFCFQFVRICITSVPFWSLIISCMFLLPVRAYLCRWRLNLVADHPCMCLLTVCTYLYSQCSILVTGRPLCVPTHSLCISAFPTSHCLCVSAYISCRSSTPASEDGGRVCSGTGTACGSPRGTPC